MPVCGARAAHQTVKRSLSAVGAPLWRIQPFPLSRWLHPVARCIFEPHLMLDACVCVCVCVFMCVQSSEQIYTDGNKGRHLDADTDSLY